MKGQRIVCDKCGMVLFLVRTVHVNQYYSVPDGVVGFRASKVARGSKPEEQVVRRGSWRLECAADPSHETGWYVNAVGRIERDPDTQRTTQSIVPT